MGEGPVLWALVVRETGDGTAVAEVVVEVDAGHWGGLATDAWESGFVAAGGLPVSTGTVQVRSGRFERLVLVGGREVWEPSPVMETPQAWLSAAADNGGVVVTVVAPGTWPPDLADVPSGRRAQTFADWLDEVRASGAVLQGVADLDLG
ncbi:hypothetical protein [Kitasatospora sp. DSM 101779]|uniref:hypothetical protein n=1 Tax=Kitasatospora sp. DSM 101779 TaxID=2853165 RepID=UPI0021DB2723|nr:hypothetical protein [Kitasatospora sp. DSM 101779]MCU7820288.1 hypothetical protein [Kitasatospora sp. DSM 101779]